MKTEILKILENQRGKFISGEELAKNFNVTRAAVWTAVDSLRSEGHKIKAVTNKGYMLENFSDVLTEKGIKAHLKKNSKISRVIYFEKIDSTNTYAKHLALSEKNTEHGTLIAANFQTAGRGRHGHNFESPAGTGLYMSLILRPKIEISKFQMITIAVAVAACLAIEDLYEDSKEKLKIKWVNDVFFMDKKIAGILTEAVTNIESGEIEYVVTGIGINVSTKKFKGEFSAGSIFDEGEFIFSRNELCAKVADYIMDFAENLGSKNLIDEYRKRSMLTGKNITYIKNDVQHSAYVNGIDDQGGLVITNDSGEKETLRSGEVFMVRNLS